MDETVSMTSQCSTHFSLVWVWINFKGPDNFMVTALGHGVKWPKVLMTILKD